MKKNRFLIPIILSAMSFLTNAHAELTTTIEADNTVRIADDSLGVVVRLDSSGKFLSLKSTYYHPVEFPDRRGISKAYIIAEEKAKANIARLNSQMISSKRLVSEIDDAASVSNRSNFGSEEKWTKENTRKVSDAVTELTESSAQIMLRGITIIDKKYDEKKEEVMVTVGKNRETMAAAAQLGNEALGGGGRVGVGGVGVGNSSGFPRVPSERTRSADYDKF